MVVQVGDSKYLYHGGHEASWAYRKWKILMCVWVVHSEALGAEIKNPYSSE